MMFPMYLHMYREVAALIEIIPRLQRRCLPSLFETLLSALSKKIAI